MRYLEVERCGTEHCPYCLPHLTREDMNYCHAYVNPFRISAKVKTFPRHCPAIKEEDKR
jgi:hypothetical protein